MYVTTDMELMDVDAVEKALGRSRASVYRYANTDPDILNPPFDPRRLNPEHRNDRSEPLLFSHEEVSRFARDVLKIKQVTIQVQEAPESVTNLLLQELLLELRSIHETLRNLGYK
ncbi:MAG: resolvase [Oscillatoriales cyanobacterium SM2_2_1]|nr:resolvase [Oscillatoriales cyanobacterium SM2_2_1]